MLLKRKTTLVSTITRTGNRNIRTKALLIPSTAILTPYREQALNQFSLDQALGAGLTGPDLDDPEAGRFQERAPMLLCTFAY